MKENLRVGRIRFPNPKIVILIACSKRSDSGERCEVKKAMKSRGALLFTSHRSPVSERLEQAMILRIACAQEPDLVYSRFLLYYMLPLIPMTQYSHAKLGTIRNRCVFKFFLRSDII